MVFVVEGLDYSYKYVDKVNECYGAQSNILVYYFQWTKRPVPCIKLKMEAQNEY